jgi:hypothetical protein
MLKEVEEPFEKDQIGSSAMVCFFLSSTVYMSGTDSSRLTRETPCDLSVCARLVDTSRTFPRMLWILIPRSGLSVLSYVLNPLAGMLNGS